MFKAGDIVTCEPTRSRHDKSDWYQILSYDIESSIVRIILHSTPSIRKIPTMSKPCGPDMGQHYSSIFYKVGPKYSRNLPEWW